MLGVVRGWRRVWDVGRSNGMAEGVGCGVKYVSERGFVFLLLSAQTA